VMCGMREILCDKFLFDGHFERSVRPIACICMHPTLPNIGALSTEPEPLTVAPEQGIITHKFTHKSNTSKRGAHDRCSLPFKRKRSRDK
jgi:hypothetical protein